MMKFIECIVLVLFVTTATGSLDFSDSLDYSHNIFIPLNAYKNYELFMEYAEDSELSRRSSGATAIPALADIPPSGTHLYRVEGVNCQVEVSTQNNKRVIKKKDCGEGWTLSSALNQFFSDIGEDLETTTAGLIHPDLLKFSKLVFEQDGFTLSGDADGVSSSHMQSNLELTEVAFEIFLPTDYSFQASKIKLVGNQDQNGKRVKVKFLKDAGETVFKASLKVPAMTFSEFATIFLPAAKFTGISVLDETYSVTIDPLKDLQIQTSEENKATGVFDPASGHFQLTGKFSSSDADAFGGHEVDLILTVDRPSLGTAERFSVAVGYKKNVAVNLVAGTFVGGNTAAFNDKLITNTVDKWYLTFTSGTIDIQENSDFQLLWAKVFDQEPKQTFNKGLGVKISINLMQTLTSCDSSATISSELNNVKVNGLMTSKGLKLKYPEGVTVPIAAVVKCSTPSTSSLSTVIPDALAAIESATGLTLEESDYERETGNIKIALAHNGKIVFYENLLETSSSKLELSKEDGEWTYTLSSDVKVFGVDASCSVAYSASQIVVKVTSDKVPLTAFLQAFSFGSDPDITFEIHDFKMQIEWGRGAEADKKISVGGKPVFNGFDQVTVEAIVYKTGGKTNVAVAVKMENIRLDEVLEKVLGISEVPMAWFSKMDLVIAIANVNAEGCDNPAQDEDSCEQEGEEEESAEGGEEEGAEDDTPMKTKAGKSKSKKKSKSTKSNKKKQKSVNKSKRSVYEVKAKHLTNVTQAKHSTNETQAKHSSNETRSKIATNGKRTLTKRDFELNTLSQIDLVQGLYIKAAFFLPDDCKDDSLCEFMKEKISKDTKLFLEGTFQKTGFELEAGVEGAIELSSKLMLTGASLKLTFTTEERSIALKVSLKYEDSNLSADQALTFTGSLTVSLSGKLEIGMTMSGMIYEPFNIKRFGFGNLNLAIGITAAAGIPSLQIGASISIGNVKNVEGQGGKFIFEGYFGFDPTDPTQNYVYAKSSGDDLTLINVIRNFGISQTLELPQPVADSGFFGDLIFSFSTSGKTIDELGIEVKAGVYFKGAFRILGLEVYAEININTDPEALAIYAKIESTPISWVGGLLRIQRTRDDDTNGPFVIVDINSEAASIEIQGFAQVLGIAYGICVKMNETHSFFTIEGNLFSVLQVELAVAATYGPTLADLSYEFNGCLQFDLTRIAKIVYDTMKSASQDVSAAMDKARGKVEEARVAVNRAFEKVKQWQEGIKMYQAQLTKRSEELDRKKKELNYDCSTRCGKVCVGFLDWNPQCWKVWGRWVGCPKWNSCKWRVADIICIAGCELKRGWNKFVTWAEQLGIQIMLGLTEVANAILNGVDAFKAIANAVLDFASGFLSVVEGFCTGVMTAVSAVVSAAANAIQVEYFCISGHLKPVENACISCRAKMSLVGIPIEWDGELCIDLSFFKAIGERTAVKHTPDIARIQAKVQSFEAQSAEIEDEKKNMEKEQGKQDSDYNEKTNEVPDVNKRRKRSHVPTKEEAYYYQQAYTTIPAPDTRNYKTTQSMMDGAPWLLTKSWTPSKRDMIPDESTAHRRILNINTKDDCKRIENVYSNYGMIAEGFNAFIKGVEKQKVDFFNMKRSTIDGMNFIKNEFQHGDYKHNVTDEEREHVKYWHDYVIEGMSQHIEATEKEMKAQRKSFIPTFRRQVDTILGEQTRSSLTNYVDQMHGAVVKTYKKRSDIPSPALVKRVSKWENLRKVFKDLAEDGSTTLRDMSAKVTSANRILQDLRRSEIPCAA